MMLGREVRQPLDLVFNFKGNVPPNEEPAEYIRKLKDRMTRVHNLARDNIGLAQNQQKKYYDHRQNKATFEEGDLVYKLNKGLKPGQSKKLQPIWKGPFLVTQVLSPILYKIQDRKKTQVIHHDLLEKVRNACHTPMDTEST